METVSNQPDLQASIDGMTVEDFNGLLTVVSWRPGLSMSVHTPSYYCGFNVQNVRVREACIDYLLNVPNTYHPNQITELHMHQPIPTFVETVEDFYDFCHGMALWFDEHEGREWFKVNGRPWRDPHSMYARNTMFNPRQVFAHAKALRPYPPQATVVVT
jgi:hypothetical protein